MNVLITGGAGFLGKRLAKQLLQRGVLKNAQGVEEKIDELVLFDMVAAEGFDDPRVKVVTGNISDPAMIKQIVDVKTGSIFHLAAVVSSQAEADFDLGMKIKLEYVPLIFVIRRDGEASRAAEVTDLAKLGDAIAQLKRD